MFQVLHLDQIDAIPVAGVNMRPVRRTLGITGFGSNGWSADADQQLIVACYAALADDQERTLDHLGRAFDLDPQTRERAAGDSDLDGIRGHPRFPL